jgi:hypothetical protein
MNAFGRVMEEMLESRATQRKSDAAATYNRELSQVTARAYLLALAVSLGGCSASEVVQNWTSAPAMPPAPDLSQPNYRRVVADNIKKIFVNSASLGDLEISEVRRVDHVKGPAWITCLKFHPQINSNATATGEPVAAPSPPGMTNRGGPQYYAIFIQDSKIIDSRFSVVIDQCHSQTFQPFDLTPPPAAKKR